MLQLRALVDEEDAAWNGAKEMFSRTCGDWRDTCLPGYITRLGQRTGSELPGEGAETTLEGGIWKVCRSPSSWVREGLG